MLWLSPEGVQATAQHPRSPSEEDWGSREVKFRACREIRAAHCPTPKWGRSHHPSKRSARPPYLRLSKSAGSLRSKEARHLSESGVVVRASAPTGDFGRG